MKVVLIGFGNVNQGFAELLVEKQKLIKENYNIVCKVVGICTQNKGCIINNEGIDLKEVLLMISKNGFVSKEKISVIDMINKIDADVMIEATYTDIKTAEPATSHIRAAFNKGMHVITTNKGPIALYYKELDNIAKQKNVKFLYEGTVMSGTPLISLIKNTLPLCHIYEIKGILNGTTNYILTKMEEGLTYESALKEAQDLGYAEAQPDADVMGWDTLAKVTILANTIFNAELKPSENRCEGITEIKSSDVERAKMEGKRYKLIGRVWREQNQVRAAVYPQKIDIADPLASIKGITNAITIATDILGDVTIVGPGAGKKETGYSVLSDLISIAKM